MTKELFDIDTSADKLIRKLNLEYPYRLFYRGLLPKFLRAPIEQKIDFNKQQRIANCWKQMLEKYFAQDIPEFKLEPKKQFKNQKIIWQFWDGKAAPEVVQICFNSVEKYKEDYEIIRLNDKNISEYLDLPDFIFEKRKNSEFKYAFFTDLLRLALLDVYGGIWIDATILLTAPIPGLLKQQDFFMFQRDKHSPYKNKWSKYNGYFNWNSQQRINHLNSFIIAKKENEIIHICLNMLLHFWQTQNSIPHYFFFQIMLDSLQRYHDYPSSLIYDDTVPHLLHKVIKKKFNLEEYEGILKKTNIHKLTYTKKYRHNSYFAYLKTQFL